MSSLCKRNCNSCILLKKYCGGCSLCEAPLCSKNCIQCFSLCPKRPGVFTYLDSIGGLDLVLKNCSTNISDFPLNIPIIPDRLKTKINKTDLPAIAVHAGNMFSRNGEKINDSYLENGYAEALNIHKGTKSILEFYIKDRTLEGFWDRRHQIYPDLKKMNFDIVISPNYSVYEDAPRIDHLYNMKRSTIVYNELLDFGINAVSDVSWYNIKDLNRWIEAINKSGIKTIAFSFQTVGVQLKASSVWKSYVLGFRYLCQNISKDVDIIAAGAVSDKKVTELYKASNGQTIYLLNQSAYVQSRRGILSETRESNKSLSLDQIFIKNLKYFNNLYREIKDEYGYKGGSVCRRQDQVVI